jgi:AcrR family transcriptional regulator
MSTPTHSRRDAERNHEAIVTAAIAALADRPEATMAEIAAASGTGRSTLYRHFPDRAALVAAISARVRDEARGIVEEHLQGAPPADAVAVLSALADTLAGLGDRYRFLLSQDERRHAKPDAERLRDDRARAYLAAAQEAGSVRDDVGAQWLADAYAHILMAAVKHSFPDPGTQRTTLEATVRSLLAPPV